MDVGALSEVGKCMAALPINQSHHATLADYFGTACTKCRLDGANMEAIYMARLALEHMGLDWQKFAQGHLSFNEEYTVDSVLLDQLLYDMSIVAYYMKLPTNEIAKYFGRWLCDLIILSPQIDNNILHTTRNNASCYYQTIVYEEKRQFDVKLPFTDTNKSYNPMNPSIVPAGRGYIAIVRSVNYTQEFAVHFTSHDSDNRIRTKNFLLGLDENLNTVWQAEIVDHSGLPKVDGALIEGLEDMRLFWLTEPSGCPTAPNTEKSHIVNQSENIDDINLPEIKDDKDVIAPDTEDTEDIENSKRLASDYYGVDVGQLGFSCTTANTHSTCVPQISIGRFSPYITKEGKISICELQPLISWKQRGNPHRLCEKNWLAFLLNDQGLMVYSYQPLTMVKCPLMIKWQKLVAQETYHLEIRDDMSEEVTEVSVQPKIYQSSSLRLEDQRGSGGPIFYTWQNIKGYLIVTHGVISHDNKRIYHQRFLFYNKQFKLQALSFPFHFNNLGIEYCSTMIPHQDGHSLLLGVGIEDREAWLYKINYNVVDDMLHSVELSTI